MKSDIGTKGRDFIGDASHYGGYPRNRVERGRQHLHRALSLREWESVIDSRGLTSTEKRYVTEQTS